MTLKHRVSALALAVLLAGPAAFASALVVERCAAAPWRQPCVCSLLVGMIDGH
jgi:hypothetical protein